MYFNIWGGRNSGLHDPERYEMLFGADFQKLLDVGSRVVTLERHFDNQRGLNREDERLPYEDQLLGFEDALDAYYDARGWHNDGTVSNMAQSD